MPWGPSPAEGLDHIRKPILHPPELADAGNQQQQLPLLCNDGARETHRAHIQAKVMSRQAQVVRSLVGVGP